MATDPLYQQIGALIQRQRKQLKWKQLHLAKILGISRGSLANIETGRQSILVHQLYKFADALGLSPRDLLPVAKSLQPLRQDWTGIIPEDLRPNQKEQVARLLESADSGKIRHRRKTDEKTKAK